MIIKKSGRILNFLGDYKRIVVFIITFMIIFATLATSVVTKKYDLRVGEIATTDIKASREVVNTVETEAKKIEAIEKVGKQYSLQTDIQKNSQITLEEFFLNLKEAITTKDTESSNGNTTSKLQLEILNEDNPFDLTTSEEMYLLTLNEEQINKMYDVLLNAINDAYNISINEDSTETLNKAIQIAQDVVYNNYNDEHIISISDKIINVLVKPNLFYDNEKTEEAQQEAAKNVTPVVYKKNQTIVEEGKPITEAQIQALDELGLLNNSKFNISLYLALAIMVIIVMYIQNRYLKKYYKDIYNNSSKLIMINIITIMTIVFARVFSIASPYLIPLACTPILLTLLLNYRISLVVSITNIILMAVAVSFNTEIIILAIVSVIVGATFLKKMQQRNDIVYSCIYIAILNGVMTLSISALVTSNLKEILLDTAFILVGSLLSGILSTGLLPFFESMFDIVTNVKLLELSNPNNPLLKKLLMEAPGTYHHSVIVANLAEVATEAVGGNALLARIGAYYHDIGKTKKPYFFKENQLGKENPHDDITPELSKLLIISHVKDGLELAREYKLPKVIQDFIPTHHGKTLVKYFYLTAKNNAENPDDIKEEDYMYPGPKPKTKEQCILMLADSVEAAVRSINNPTKEKIENMVDNIVKDKLSSGQLDDSQLTISDVKKIKKCFLKTLNGIYHERIEYPKDERKTVK
ncbi:Predicted HD superfamily hydrolase [Sarcina ventriculi]|nr:HDIG domain-containing metalloprotein [Sarcina sp. JB2]MCI5636159.1 HDIG domain-containing protein [Sarcina ventriculi]MDO4401717.1 HDIG domain-containing protein [Clostridiaceae bacterium]MDD7373483.1 HDIG domain-containing protein [Sarcina ventriculi]CUN99659.1 Predicted HD superfamily hydrolase [Sarcina ventriculi]SPZ50647.1 Predicted HD superfamily hydrolase [Sarcina ventriculi]